MQNMEDLSIQLYSLRDYGALDGQLAALARIGFRCVETVGYHLNDAATTRRLLDANGMTAPTGHVGMAELRTRPDWVAQQAKTVGIAELFMPAMPPEERDMTPDGWRKAGAELGAIAVHMQAHGLKLGYHNHHWELAPFPDGSTPLRHFFDGAKGSPMTFEADLAWLVRGKADPLAWMAAEAPRLTAVHVKDIAPPGQNADEDGWADIGKGVLDWAALWTAAMTHGCPRMVLEHDKPKEPVSFARDSRDWLLAHL